ncbi:membrane-associated phospholipid phosphatase [Oleiphilus messinensis]|uniref:undecaprenyl-diphosphate phosphatase n=1 Tax=Oleiphilus messinensis TaxID=141451 RepID=A0A1Y0I4W8_9GAMM|nr:phosphatase PAP2 family protein [Oleiphilus messinensis]ARU55280.1 membrane-associated phospholipid phosphatase [Oleiphilus messinensis]
MLNSSKTTQFFQRIDQAEFNLCRKANQIGRLPAVHRFFSIVSRLGDGVFWYCFILALPALFGIVGMTVSLLMIITGITCTIVYKSLKAVLVRERPYISHPDILAGTPPLDRYSFPSGHTLHAVCFAIILVYHFPWLGLIVLPFTILVMLSRVLLGLHYPTDVSAGALIGALISYLAIQTSGADTFQALLNQVL